RLSTFISVTISLLVGAVILISIYGSDWHVATAMVSSPYRAFSSDRISARVGVHIGLNSVNITLQATPRYSDSEEINFNEKFTWFGPTQIKKDYREALVKGLPFPILTIAEYLSQDLEGFCWGRRYRVAGYYAFALLWTAFALWLLMNVLLCAVPRYGAYAMQLTGALMLLSNAIYTLLMPRKPLVIPFQGGLLRFSFGWCFWAVMGAGGLAVLCGALVAVLDMWFPNKFSTILEVDYDTPYRYFVGQDYVDRKPSTVASQLGSKVVLGSPEWTTFLEAQNVQSCVLNLSGYFKIYNDNSSNSILGVGFECASCYNYGGIVNRAPMLCSACPRAAARTLGSSFTLTPAKDVNINLQSAAMW
ncbi:unnamed protein product, partial [Ixodes hexagonus]